jgi:hypothetical protein
MHIFYRQINIFHSFKLILQVKETKTDYNYFVSSTPPFIVIFHQTELALKNIKG